MPKRMKISNLAASSYIDWMLSRSYPSPEEPLALPKFILFFWKLHAELGKHDCNNAEGRFALLLWWFNSGKKEYPNLSWDLTASDLAYLFCFPADRELPMALSWYVCTRQDLQSTFNLETEKGRADYLIWWATEGQQESFPQAMSDYFFRAFTTVTVSDSGEVKLPLFLKCCWWSRQDLQSTFNLETEKGRADYLTWWEKHGQFEYHSLVERASGWMTTQEANGESSSELSAGDSIPVDRKRAFESGLNIVGFVRGGLGIGEDARMALAACNSSRIRATAVEPKLDWSPEVHDQLFKHEITDSLVYNKTLFCLPPPEMIRLALSPLSYLVAGSTYRIGSWPWELPHWPDEFYGISNLVDEIWAPSRYIQTAFSFVVDKPIYLMPLAVELERPANPCRAKFKLPDKDFIFLVMFDGNSRLTRKNPSGAIQAFLKAFHRNKKGVKLLIKAMNLRADDPEWVKIIKQVQHDERVIIIDKFLDRADSLELLDCCNAYISLHRAEGFGRIIAEAMLLEKPVVVSKFSGNLDFCTTKTSYLVEGGTILLQKNDYPFWEGQYWFDPDIESAASKLIEVMEDNVRRQDVTINAHNFIIKNHSAKAVGDSYTRRLLEIDAKQE